MKPMLSPLLTLVLTSISFFACKKENATSHQPSAKANALTGKVRDTRGNLIQGAEIISEHTVWHNSYTKSVSDATGNFKVVIPEEPAGSWTAKAQLSKTAWGQTYVFDLAADKTDPYTAKEGAERNFTWKLNGQREGSNTYYGAHVDLYQFGIDVPMTDIKLVFTPFPGETTLIDGSPAVAFERSIEDIAGTFMVKDMPIGKYEVKAVYPGKKLLLDYRHNSGTPTNTKTVVFGKYGYLAATEYNISFWLSE